MKIGWSMVIETTNGMVGLWTNWFGEGFKLFYPLNVNISDELIMETLNVTLAKSVANKRFGTRLWAKYYSEKLDDCGRVWIAQETDHSYCYHIKTIRNKQFEYYHCGFNLTNAVCTYDINFCSKSEPEAPNCIKKNIQPYKDKFVQLLVKIAKLIGDITAVNLDCLEFLYTPEMLTAKGYAVKKWQVNRAEYCYAQDENFEIMLKRENSWESWSTVIRYFSTNELTAESLIKLVESLDYSENSFTPIPFIAQFAE